MTHPLPDKSLAEVLAEWTDKGSHYTTGDRERCLRLIEAIEFVEWHLGHLEDGNVIKAQLVAILQGRAP